ncbi:C/D box methylation guide ribonucleoprotein complex aNOP56 subunit [Sulfuracidifex metallicus]|uniref:C/D box methylation guide ribonucleoprotein complex aNOP56 subunit n=1 Tax=Sulfuracidifex metallicus DSM 6482 = JCM 9184 TaxID=523847 RepID=A0A6A9QLC4_SULME|nr:C/D box methylation guide ribonucleoprotein complex aNOP56 subunit [Sulfuracidifex metallicus]MUN27981.1 C/D box methylation guide ribonucleoprotein complex aNOP56 subunit [Sulfuracidifex metallicus DSM 6482 = JCM 9184]WOE51471.1 C/D box methylation guide ribonucleoprotein complex aNOP56 subunit [Sulfuracidifex metallicus DSM 6482 = JCM 9184]
MKVYLVEHAIGSFAFDENGELKDFVVNGKDVGKIVSILTENEKGVPFPSAVELLKKLNPSEVVVENESEVPQLQAMGYKATFKPHHLGARTFRESMVKYALESKFAEKEEEVYSFLYQLSMEYTRSKLRGASQRRDLLAIQAIRAIDDIDKTINLFSERLREWYSLHFPELDRLIEDHLQYARIISYFGYRDNIALEGLKEIGFTDNKASKIYDAAKKSIGADISDDDLKAVRMLSDNILEKYKIRDNLTNYLEEVMREVAPNVTALVGASLGARLLSIAGSLQDLAKMPASTIQVLGAEKALFRALRSGSRPPKHGVIFQYQSIHMSPRWQRGKIARALAAKLAIASRIDAFSGRYVGDQLVESLNKRIEEIKTKYAQPPARPAKEDRGEPREERREERRGGGSKGKWRNKKGKNKGKGNRGNRRNR